MTQGSINFDRASEYYDATRGFPEGIAEKISQFLAEMLGLTPQDRLLEIGVGTGRLALPISSHVGHITGVDISRNMMRQLLKKRSNQPVSVAEADAHYLPFVSAAFDCAYIVHVLHLVADPLRVLDELSRVIKPQGMLLHMHNQMHHNNEMKLIATAWNKHKPQRRTGVDWFEGDDFVRDAGWQYVTRHVYTYETQTTPRQFIEGIEKRRWSNTWDADEKQLQRGLAAVRRAVDVHLDGNADVVLPRTEEFIISVYRPPA